MPIEWWTVDRSAQQWNDYYPQHQTLAFIGQQTFNIQTIENSLPEGLESLEIHIKIVGRDDSEIVLEADILDDDAAPFSPYVVTYAYDPFDQLVHRHYDPDGAGGSAPATDQFFSWYAGQINLQFGSASATYPSHRDFWNPLAVDQLFADEEVTSSSAGTVLWALTDQLGTIRDIATHDSQNGTVIANHRVFDSYGNLTLEWNTSFEIVFGFTGVYFDTVTSLGYNRHRWYDPHTGRWVSEDPTGFGGGDTNLDRYVGNSPLNFIDPSGLASWSFYKWLYTGDGYASDEVYEAAINAAGASYGGNGARDVLRRGAIVDPTGAADIADTMLSGVEEGKNPFVIAGEVVIAVLPGPNPKKGKQAVGAVEDARKIGLRPGCKGLPDHQSKVDELVEKLKTKAGPDDVVVREGKIRGHDSNRRPDVQIVGPDGKTKEIAEAERLPNSKRNRLREEEYDTLGIPHTTHPLGPK